MDSVFVFEKKYENRSAMAIWSYISSGANLLVKREKRDSLGNAVVSEELLRVVRK